MRKLLLFVALLGVVALSAMPGSVTKAGNSQKKESATMRFREPVQIMGVTLKGEYLFVHDDAAMARGEACTYVYKGTTETASALVLSFHCTPAERTKVKNFTVRTLAVSPVLTEIRELQFSGSTEAHLVPATAK